MIIYGENDSFDNYFATYPVTLNPNDEQPHFYPKDDTPSINGLSAGLLTDPNLSNPLRLGRADAYTCSFNHPRLPFLVISPWAKTNFVDHTITDQTSSLRFIEENWGCNMSTRSSNPPARVRSTGWPVR